MKKSKIVKLGSLYLSDCVCIADPSYNFGDEETINLDNFLEGKYFANIKVENLDGGKLVSSLHICHENYKKIKLPLSHCGFVYVDSGQAGFFDKDYFIAHQGGEVGNLDSLYGLTCSITSSPKQAGVIQKKGVVSTTGFGDGCYKVYIGKNESGKIVKASVMFIEPEELEEFSNAKFGC